MAVPETLLRSCFKQRSVGGRKGSQRCRRPGMPLQRRDCSAQARQNAVMWTLPAMFDVICWHRFATAFEVWHLVARGRMWTLVGCSIKFSCSRLLTATYTCCPSASCAA